PTPAAKTFSSSTSARSDGPRRPKDISSSTTSAYAEGSRSSPKRAGPPPARPAPHPLPHPRRPRAPSSPASGATSPTFYRNYPHLISWFKAQASAQQPAQLAAASTSTSTSADSTLARLRRENEDLRRT